jgi:CTP-dependent riboflavin kinase
MIILKGIVQNGVRHFEKRIKKYGDVFTKATGEKLFPGTLNLNVGFPVSVKEHFRVRGVDIDEPDQDLIFEVCRVSGIWSYRIRPYHLPTGRGGHGDDVIEIASSMEIPGVPEGSVHDIELFRDSLE